jgi:HEAT repeat protein
MYELLMARPTFLTVFGLLSFVYLLLKFRLARPRIRVEALQDSAALHVVESSQDLEEISEALEELARTRDRRAVDALGRLLAHPDPRISAAAANVLGLIGDERALAYLFESVGRLEREMEQIEPADAERGDGVAPAQVPAPEPEPPAAAEPLDDLVWPDHDEGRRQLEAHAKPGSSEVSLVLSLVALATDPEAPDDYRYFALKNLELVLPDSPLVLPPEPGEPRQAPPPEALARELAMLLSDPKATIRYAAVGALEVMRGNDVARYVEGAIGDTNRYVRARACLALAGMAPNKARKHLFSLLSDPDEQVRRAAQRTLDEIDAANR